MNENADDTDPPIWLVMAGCILAVVMVLFGMQYDSRRANPAPEFRAQGETQADTNRAETLYAQGVAFQKAGDTNEAIRCYRSALAFSPYNWRANNGMGTIRFQGGDYPVAVGYFGLALIDAPSGEKTEIRRKIAEAESHYTLASRTQ